MTVEQELDIIHKEIMSCIDEAVNKKNWNGAYEVALNCRVTVALTDSLKRVREQTIKDALKIIHKDIELLNENKFYQHKGRNKLVWMYAKRVKDKLVKLLSSKTKEVDGEQ